MARKFTEHNGQFDNAGFQQYRLHVILYSYQDARRNSNLNDMLIETQNLFDEIIHSLTTEEEKMVQELISTAGRKLKLPSKYHESAHEYIDRSHKLLRQIADDRRLLSRHAVDLKGITGGR